MTKKEQEQTTDIIPEIAETKDIKSLIYVVRGQQVMMDSDLAMLYQVDTKVFNQAVSRNIKRFPENFRFQLTKEEFDALRSQVATSNGRGGRRYRPYMFTEQGIAMIYDKTYMVLADGDYALAVSEGTFGGTPTSYYDLFRVENGKIAEHWDVMETIADKETWANENGKF